MQEIQASRILDAKGLPCPLPILKVKREITAIEVGEILAVWTTDPGSLNDFPAWARATGHEIVKADVGSAPYRFWLRRTH
ncbi:sulfurtransferase TusA family protein [Sulfobacillus harzensis]|uniref:Sulfurtransferase TusA family protein n=1 Tax=Sulfobacillus harzensis TaxID=2729629 RepID=A0A7Y0L0E9_9FIRM|nr:sulfurtransferase TusA family protein [Sulfobacillus harzensis]NMP20978.1 sulfurtransferase TusA family protein [Sulfobacillus harzensis]